MGPGHSTSGPRVELIEVGPRDGLQNESTPVSTVTKVALIERAIACGIRRIEATSFVHPGRVPQMADAEAVMAAVPRREDVRYSALVLNRRGFDRAVDAGVDEINVVAVATDTFSRRNQGVDASEGLTVAVELVARARQAGLDASVTIAAAFGCPYEGEVPPERVSAIAERLADAGPAEIVLADTIGVGVPVQVEELAGRVRAVAPGVALRGHFHNTRNTGYANAMAAVQAGMTALDASLGGIGGCPFAPGATGNIATEDLAYLLNRSGVATDVRPGAAAETGLWMGHQLGAPVPALLGRAGIFPAPT